MDKITLGIPIYNASAFIECSLLSALNQTYPDIEYLFIDDKGDSMDIVNRVVENHPRKKDVHIIDQGHNQGIAVARNMIVEKASGKYLFVMDCDDVIRPDCLELLYKKMQEHPVDFVAASFVRRDSAGKEYPGCQYADTLIEGEGHPVARYRYGEGKEIFVATWNKLYPVDFLHKYRIRCKEGHFNEDPWFTYQVILNARSCRLLPDCTLYYTYNPDSVSGKNASKGYSEKIARQYVEVQQLKSRYIPSLQKEDFYRNLLVDIWTMCLYHAYRIEESSLLSSDLKRALVYELLSIALVFPDGKDGGRRTVQYGMLRFYFSLPMLLKYGLVAFVVSLRLKKLVGKCVHLK